MVNNVVLETGEHTGLFKEILEVKQEHSGQLEYDLRRGMLVVNF